MSKTSGSRNHRIALLLGLAISALTAGCYLVGLFAPAERVLYDQLFRVAGPVARIRDVDLITHVDLDDASLEEVGRWPWPRQRLAEVVTELNDLGARRIVLDIIMPEPQVPRLRNNPYARHFDLVGASQIIQGEGDVSDTSDPSAPDPRFIHDDRLLSDAIKQAGNVTLSMHFETFVERGRKLPLPQAEVRAKIEELLDEDPAATALDAARAIHPSAATEAGPIQDQIFGTFRETRAMRYVRSSSLAGDHIAPSTVRSAVNAVPPIPPLAESANGIAFVYFEPDGDGIMRRIQLLMSHRNRIYPQLSLLLAADAMDVPLDTIRSEPGWITMPDALLPDGARKDVRIPLDDDGSMLINWRFLGPGLWQTSFRHVAIRGLLTIARNRQLIHENESKLIFASAAAVELGLPEDDPRRQEYADLVNFARNLMNARGRNGKLDAVRQMQLDDALAGLAEPEMVTAADEARKAMQAIYDSPVQDPPTTPEEAKNEQIRDIIHGLAVPMLQPEQLREENRRLTAAIEHQQAELRPLVDGKICFIGSTATGAADFVPTPLVARCPGVVVHSNILNTILADDFIRIVPRWFNLLAILVCGLVASFIASTVDPRLTVVLVFVVMVAIAALNALVAFASMGTWVVLAAPLSAVLLVWAFVAAYRQLTEQRQRRQVTRTLGSFTSPSIAGRVAENPELLDPALREVTCFFSDLKGFTPISESLGPEKTVDLLKRYLDRMTDALLASEATINKFLGDGIFAFFGAPEVQEDHAVRAVTSAIACRDALAEFSRGLPEGSPELAMRIGIASGPAVVGQCGSSRKFDYTAIGDTVNLAARLEPANKFFGTSIMISGGTAASLDGKFLLRPLGRLVVVGQQQVTEVFELVDRADQSSEVDRVWVARWSEALELYQSCKFSESAAAFESIVADRGSDSAASVYVRMCRDLQRELPGGDWNGAIELTQK